MIIARDSPLKDAFGMRAMPHTRIRNYIEQMRAPNILVVLDSCFSGAFEGQTVSKSKGGQYANASRDEIIRRLMGNSERRALNFLTSGGKEYVDDGAKGKHSPFAAKFIEALNNPDKESGIVTFGNLREAVIKVTNNTPHWGRLAGDAEGKEFIFVRQTPEK